MRTARAVVSLRPAESVSNEFGGCVGPIGWWRETDDVTAFVEGEPLWIERLGNLRNTIRQEMIRRQLARHVDGPISVLDVGCGQGTQAIELATRGCEVTGIEPSADLRNLFADEATRRGVHARVVDGTIDALPAEVSSNGYDLVCAHGLLMYLDDRADALRRMGERVALDGRLSVTFRNGHALAFRPALRRDWDGALAAFESVGYVNEIGVSARADRLEDVEADLAACGFEIERWYGVRVFNDAISPEANIPGDEDLNALLDAEERAGDRDPYRWFASQFHVIAHRRTTRRGD